MTGRRRWLLATLLVLIVLAAGIGVREGIQALRKGIVLRSLPVHPRPTGINDSTAALLAAARDAVEENPLSVDRLGRLAMVYHAHQLHDEAARVYAILEERDPERYRWAFLHAVVAEELRDWDSAARLYGKVTRLGPEEAEAWARWSLLALKMGRLAEGRDAAERAVRIEPRHPLACYARARYAAVDRDWEEVVAILSETLQRNPDFSDAHKEIGRALHELGREEEAARHQRLGEFGEAVDGPLLQEVYALSVPAILGGDPEGAPALIRERCRRCHTPDRMFHRPGKSDAWWAGTVRRMQRLAGRTLLTDEEAARVAAYLASPRPDSIGAGADSVP